MKSSRKNGFHHPHLVANTALVAYRLADTCIPELKGICENSTPSNSTRASEKKKEKNRATYYTIIYHPFNKKCSTRYSTSASAEALPEMSCSVGFFNLQALVLPLANRPWCRMVLKWLTNKWKKMEIYQIFYRIYFQVPVL